MCPLEEPGLEEPGLGEPHWRVLEWLGHGFRIGYEPEAEGGRSPPYIYWEPANRRSPRLTMPIFTCLVDAGLVARTSPSGDQFHLTDAARALLAAR